MIENSVCWRNFPQLWRRFNVFSVFAEVYKWGGGGGGDVYQPKFGARSGNPLESFRAPKTQTQRRMGAR
jgi:hypothetical protein